MAYCPADRIEYDDELEECVVCGGPLIEGSAEEMYDEVKPAEWIELDPLPELAHALKVRDALDQENIPCIIRADMSSSGSYYGEAVVCVPEPKYDLALELQQGTAPPDDDKLLFDPDSEDEW